MASRVSESPTRRPTTPSIDVARLRTQVRRGLDRLGHSSKRDVVEILRQPNFRVVLKSAIAPRTPTHPLLRGAKYRPLLKVVRTAAFGTTPRSKVDVERAAAIVLSVVVAFAKTTKEQEKKALLRAATERQRQRRAGRIRSLSTEESQRHFAALHQQLKNLIAK